MDSDPLFGADSFGPAVVRRTSAAATMIAPITTPAIRTAVAAPPDKPDAAQNAQPMPNPPAMATPISASRSTPSRVTRP